MISCPTDRGIALIRSWLIMDLCQWSDMCMTHALNVLPEYQVCY